MLHHVKKSFAALLVAAGFAALPVLAQSPGAAQTEAAAKASPALWTIEKPGGGTITLFGSVHILPKEQDWRSEAFKAAFEKADVVVFETPIADMATPELQSYLQTHMLNPPGVTLSTLLSPEEKATVEAAALALGAPLSALEPLRPWIAGLQLAVGFAVKQGFDPNAGVDKQVEAEAKAAGKETAYFETGREQLDIFITLTTPEEVAFLVAGARDMVETPSQLSDLVAAWVKGDVAKIDVLMNEGLEETPSLAKRLLEDRNARWAETISGSYMGDSKTYLIIVGAAHLAGEKSVVAMLRAKGITVAGP